MKISVKSQQKITSIEADGFDNLLSVLRFYGYKINTSCNGLKKCGNCKVLANQRLVSACATKPEDNMEVEIIDADFCENYFENSEINSASAVVDIGTTTVRCALVSDTKIISILSEKNSQVSFGADVISRIENAEGINLGLMHSAIITQINSMLRRLAENIEIKNISIVGNTAMLHIFLNTPCKTMGVYPYTPVFLEEKNFASAKEVGLDFESPLYVLPSISAFCGADIVADIAEVFVDNQNCSLLIDFGTNAEIAVVDNDRIFVTSAAAGPAFECGNISCGMSALSGAVCNYKIENSIPVINTINKKTPVGICGSGLVDVIAEMLKNNIIDKSGYLKNDFEIYKNVFITQSDIREFQLAKAAVTTATKLLLKKISRDISRVYICGNFGKHLNIENAKLLGLIPQNISEVFILENSPVSSVIQSDKNLWKKISEDAEYVDISSDETFEKTFENSLDF